MQKFNRPLLAILFTLMLFTLGCQNHTVNQPTSDLKTLNQRPDPHSFSRHDQVKVTHLSLDLAVKFKSKILEGSATLSYERIKPEANKLILDSRNLKVIRVAAVNDSKNPKLMWRYGATIAGLGTELIIDLPADQSPIRIDYHTSPEASGLQWLNPSQTTSQNQPYLFSQSQSIHARSWIPIQDSPSVRVTYDARIKVKQDVRVVLSADNNDQTAEDGVYTFNMPLAIPAYLIAIAVGDIEHQNISEHVTIYAEEPVMASAVHEFGATEAMIAATEAMYGPYRWGQYDLLVLPASFPFGGMENPKLSHITPTIIAGDRSLDALIAHELAHSWSGNLVTNALWQDAWLNEGFTSYIEARIIEAIYGKERLAMEATLVYQSLLEAMADMTPDEQKLINPNLSQDPDDYFSAVSYDKGRFFLDWMEQQVGRDVFDAFLNQYFDHHAFQSITTPAFVAFLDQHLLQENPGKITLDQVHTWLHEPGIPSWFTPPSTDRFKHIDQLVADWQAGQTPLRDLDTQSWTTQEWLHFLKALPTAMTTTELAELDHAFNLTERQNSEVAHVWLLISIRHQYQPAYARLIDYLTQIGRVKLIKPLYEALMAEPALHELADNIYFKARPGYHNIATRQIDEIVGYEPKDEAEG